MVEDDYNLLLQNFLAKFANQNLVIRALAVVNKNDPTKRLYQVKLVGGMHQTNNTISYYMAEFIAGRNDSGSLTPLLTGGDLGTNTDHWRSRMRTILKNWETEVLPWLTNSTNCICSIYEGERKINTKDSLDPLFYAQFEVLLGIIKRLIFDRTENYYLSLQQWGHVAERLDKFHLSETKKLVSVSAAMNVFP